MPYPNEHSCRIKAPGLFETASFRRIEKGEGADKLSIIIGRLKGERTTTTQAYRYDKGVWDEARAKEHCDGEGGTFEPATKEAKSMIDLSDIDTLAKAYALHNKIHSEYVDARFGSRRKVQVQADHEAVVRQILELGGKHLPKGEALDETLSQELKEAFKLASLYYVCDTITLTEDEPPCSTIQILRVGTFYSSKYGKFRVTQDMLDSMVKNFNERHPKPPTEMVVDWEHMSGATEPPVKSPAAGWVKGLSIGDGKLFADVEWTAEAADEIRKREYRFISPEFHLNYLDKDTGKRIGATLLAIALTNRPFIEGMEPVVLSESLGGLVVCAEEVSYADRERKVRDAYDRQFGMPGVEFAYRQWVVDVYDEYCIVQRVGELFKLPYSIEDDAVVFDKSLEVKVEKQYVEVSLSEKEVDLIGTSADPVITGGDKGLGLAEWTTAYINDLPDNAFACIKSGGEKDEEGKAMPRSLRYLPYKDKDGKADLPHLRNALVQLPKTNLASDEKAKAHKVLIAVAQKAGVGEYSGLPNTSKEEWNEVQKMLKEGKQLDKELREILGLAEDADLVATIKALKTSADESTKNLKELQGKLAAAEKRTDEAEGKVTLAEANKLVQDAIDAGKILPKQEQWAREYALNDRQGFISFVETAEKVAPSLEEKGKTGDDGDIQLTEVEIGIAEKLNIPKEDMIKAKEAVVTK